MTSGFMAKHVPGRRQAENEAAVPSSAELDSASGGVAPAVVKGAKLAFKFGKIFGRSMAKDTAKEFVKDQVFPASSSEEA